MCKYRYQYYPQCAHVELYCFRFCDRAIDLSELETQVEARGTNAILEAANDDDNSRRHFLDKPNTEAKSSAPDTSLTKTVQQTDTEIIRTDPSFAYHNQHHYPHHHQASRRGFRSQSTPPHPIRPGVRFIKDDSVSALTSSAISTDTMMTHSARVTHAGPFGVKPHELGHEVWGDDVRPLRHLRDESVASHQSGPSLRGGEADMVSIRTISTSNTSRAYKTYSNNAALGDDYASLEAGIDALRKQVQKLKRADQRCASSSSDETIVQERAELEKTSHDTDGDMSTTDRSAAARLQKLHERSGRPSPIAVAPDTTLAPAFEPEHFPTLGRAPNLLRSNAVPSQTGYDARSLAGSYADIAKDVTCSRSMRNPSPNKTTQLPSPNQPERTYRTLRRGLGYVNDRSHDQSSETTSSTTVPSRSPNKTHFLPGYQEPTRASMLHELHPNSDSSRRSTLGGGGSVPRFATDKRAADRHRRKTLPKEWASQFDLDQATDQDREHTVASHDGILIPQAGNVLKVGGDSASKNTLRIPVRNSDKEKSFKCGDSPRQTHDHDYTPSRGLRKTKSHSSLISPAKMTIGRTSNFASPTAASKQRSAYLSKTVDPTSPTKVSQPDRLRAGDKTIRRQKPIDGHFAQRTATIRSTHDHELLESSSNLRTRATTERHSFFLASRDAPDDEKHEDDVDDALFDDYPSYQTGVRDSSRSESLSGHRRMSKPLKIRIPTAQSSVMGPPDMSRIPRSAQMLYACPASPVLTASVAHQVMQSGNNTTAVPNAVVGNDTLAEELTYVPHMTGERAALLHPIVRRLSSAGSQKARSRSGTTNEPVCSDTATPSIKEGDWETVDIRSAHSISEDIILGSSAEAANTTQTDTPSVPTSVFATASSWLLGTIKQTAVDHAKYLQQDVEEKEPAPTLQSVDTNSSIGDAIGDVPLQRLTSSQPSRDVDPAIVSVGRVTESTTCTADVPETIETSSKATSLRATASIFIPTMAIEASQEVTVEVPAMVDYPYIVPFTQPITPVDQQIPSLTSPPFSQAIPFFSPSEWNSLPSDVKRHIKDMRRTGGSSDSSFSNFSNSSYGTTFSAGPSMASLSPEVNQPKFDWMNAARSGSTVRFGRAPLPSMDEESPSEEISHSKGWGIGSAAPGWWYGWRGGDGLEISFVGHGPDAERYPDAPVNFRNYKRGTTSQGSLIPSQKTPEHGAADEGGSGPPTAPRKMRDWATRMGYSHVPCGDLEVTHAVEHVGGPLNRVALDGWCGNCVPIH